VDRFPSAHAVLAAAIDERAFPAAVVEVGSRHEVLWREAHGRLSEESEAPVTREDTVFDLASLTKVIATTTLVMTLVEEERLRLSDPVARWLPDWRGRDRSQVSVEDLLAHTAGLTAWAPLYRDCTGRVEMEAAICELPLEYRPRSQAVYSDLGFILLGFVVEDAGGAPLDEQFATVRNRMGADAASSPSGFPAPARHRLRRAAGLHAACALASSYRADRGGRVAWPPPGRRSARRERLGPRWHRGSRRALRDGRRGRLLRPRHARSSIGRKDESRPGTA
jgi:CubicO group peptidase (beta-lactamase class C family)